MKKQVAKVIHNGTFIVVYDDAKERDPYTLYRKYYSDGYHTKKIASCPSLLGCMYYLEEEILKR